MNKETQGVLFSSENMAEVTPQDLFDQLDAEFHFKTDLAASAKNTKCKRFYSEKDSAFEKTWKGSNWGNPPYGRGIIHWTCKAEDESKSIYKPTIVMLLPARTDTKWFEVIADSADEIRFIKGRLKFGTNTHAAPFPSMLAIWNIRECTRGPMQHDPYHYNLIWRR